VGIDERAMTVETIVMGIAYTFFHEGIFYKKYVFFPMAFPLVGSINGFFML
jgi:hypothetical protein